MKCEICGGNDWHLLVTINNSYLVMGDAVLQGNEDVGVATALFICIARKDNVKCGHEVERTMSLDEYENVKEQLEKGKLPDEWIEQEAGTGTTT